VGEQQRVEVLKMLYRGAKVLIMDEPTAVLTPQEVEDLFVTLHSMLQRGHSIVFISHKLDEVRAIANRVTVLRRGRVTAPGVSAKGATKTHLAQLMVGREVVFTVKKTPVQPGKTVLDLQGINAENDRGVPALRGFSLAVCEGEIVGLAGVAGNGQSELAQVITGLRELSSGKVIVNGEDLTNKDPRVAINRHIAHVPEDRTGVGSSPGLSLAENLIMKNYRSSPISTGWALNRQVIRKQATEIRQNFDIAAPNIDVQARLLSGGNLQKAILAREIGTQPKLIVACQPTRGLDVGAIEAVHRHLLAERERGTAILLISEELDEVMSLADRIVGIYEGQNMGELSAEEATLGEIGLMMAGTRHGTTESGAAGTHGARIADAQPAGANHGNK
jgi:simple sugar transport system ATP-binding protein